MLSLGLKSPLYQSSLKGKGIGLLYTYYQSRMNDKGITTISTQTSEKL
jgi:hypothetical protein